MNEEILIELGEVSEETKGCPGGFDESQIQPVSQPALPDGKCPQ